MYVDWGPPHLSLVVCYIFHLLIPLPCKTWFYKDCNRNCKNPVLDSLRTLGKSNLARYYNLQNICLSSLINLDTVTIMSPKIDAPYLWTVGLGPLKFSLRATIDHHGPSIHSGHYTASINCCKKKHSIATIPQLRSLELLMAKTPLLHVILYELIDIWVLDSNRRVGVWSLPWRWHILSIPLTTGRGTGAETCELDDVFPPDDLCSCPESLC